MLRPFEIIRDRLKKNNYRKVQYLPTRKSIAVGKEFYVFESFFYEKVPCIFYSTCLYTLYHLIFRSRYPQIYKLYKSCFMNEPTEREFLLTLFNSDEIDGFIREGIIRQKDQQYTFNFRFVPFEDLILVAKVDMKDPEYAHINYDSVTFVEFLRKMHLNGNFSKALEIGCGAGLISIELSKFAKEVDAVDINPNAVKLMGINAGLNGISTLNAFLSDCYGSITKKYDLIVSDPPFEIMPLEEKSVLHRYGGILGMEIALKILFGLDEFLNDKGEAIIFTNSYVKNFKVNLLKDAIYDIFKNKRFDITLYELSYQITPEFYPTYRRFDISHSIGYIIHIRKGQDFKMVVIPLGFFSKIKEIFRLFYLYTYIFITGKAGNGRSH